MSHNEFLLLLKKRNDLIQMYHDSLDSGFVRFSKIVLGEITLIDNFIIIESDRLRSEIKSMEV